MAKHITYFTRKYALLVHVLLTQRRDQLFQAVEAPEAADMMMMMMSLILGAQEEKKLDAESL